MTVNNQDLEALRATLAILTNLEKSLPDLVDGVAAEEQVELGLILAGIAKHSKSALEKAKLSLRESARGQLEEQYGTVVVKSRDRRKWASVHFPRPQAKLRKRVDIGKLQRILGQLFPVFFNTSYTPTKDFTEHLKDLEDPSGEPTEALKAVLEAVDLPESTPRVTYSE